MWCDIVVRREHADTWGSQLFTAFKRQGSPLGEDENFDSGCVKSGQRRGIVSYCTYDLVRCRHGTAWDDPQWCDTTRHGIVQRRLMLLAAWGGF